MLIISRLPGALVAVIPWTALASVLTFLSVPCRADIAPESAVLAHVQSVSTWPCYTQITSCNEIIRSTSADGPVEFLLFFMRGAYSWPGETICIRSLDSGLSWPETWQLVAFEPCGWGAWGSLGASGPVHSLHIEWNYDDYEISELPGGVIPVASVVMNAAGPGWLDLVPDWGPPGGQVELQRNCSGSTFTTYPVQIDAEAGMQCGYVSAHCGYRENACLAVFEVPELRLSVPLGGAADSTVGFWAYMWYNPELLCDLEVETHASWCTAWIDPLYEIGLAHLHVTADAAGLPPGMYETDIELSNAHHGVSRCLPVAFDVEGSPTAVWPASWGRIKALYR